MKLSLGIVGLPNVGKSTLFKLLTEQDVLVANYPFATIDPAVGVVAVPDARVQLLAAMSKSKKTVPAVVEFYDIAGLVKGASEGQGLGNQFLSHVRECQALVMVLRVFGAEGKAGSDVIHVEGTVDPMRDLEIIEMELMLKDLDTVNKRLNSLEKEARVGSKEAKASLDVLSNVKAKLEAGVLPTEFAGEPVVRELSLLSAKKQLFLLNGAPDDVSAELVEKIASLGAEHVVMDLSAGPDLAPLIAKTYTLLGLASFFTTGEDETRAWTIEAGTKAPQASGVIHTDFEHKFIRLEVVGADELLASGSWAAAKQKGLIRLEGKEYVVQDGDVVVVRHG
jgi:ribosome-binding ATPase YchF (GTP1/OBG family)